MQHAALLSGLAAAAVLAASCRMTGPRPDPFFLSPADPGASLPADGVYPNGRKMPFLGYSGVPARDLTNGFSVAGPVYGDQRPYLATCVSNGWPVVAHIGLHVTFNDKAPDKYRVDEPSLRREVSNQVRELAVHREILWWAVHPEELRPWRKDEMNYLDLVTDTIRRTDPLARPVFMYNPNNRDATSLRTVAPYLDVIGKGCYVNLAGHKRNRAWVRWSVEQELAALRDAGRPGAIPLLMPELCADPDPAEDGEIRAWVRHDVYLGLCAGARGVFIWSLFKRREVGRTWKLWYDAYAECARELNGELGLAAVFLFGEPRADIVVAPEEAGLVPVRLGGQVEPATTSARENAGRAEKAASWTRAEFAYQGARWFFLVNSANTPAAFALSGWPEGTRAFDAFTGSPRELSTRVDVELPDRRGGRPAILFEHPARVELPAYGVLGIRLAAPGN